MPREREARIFRNGRNQAVRIPREFEFSGERVIMRKIGKRLILEPAPQRKLAEVLDIMNVTCPSSKPWIKLEGGKHHWLRAIIEEDRSLHNV